MKHFFFVYMTCILCVQVNAQTTPWIQQGNNGIIPGVDMLGTTDDSPIPLVTNGNLRMLLTAGTGGQSGQIGIGNNLANAFVPQQRLHLHQGNDNNDNFIRWSNGDIGNMTGLDIGLLANSDNAQINQIQDNLLLIAQNNINRMTFRELNTWNGLNGATDPNATRVTLGYNGETTPAWSMLHLWKDGIAQQVARNWMDVGVTMIGNSDVFYAGLMERPIAGNDTLETDAVLAWGCQDGSMGNNVDNMRIVFISTLTQGGIGGGSSQGLETMRITPTGNVGIGDFSTMPGGLAQQPTHRLDVDGTARLRQMTQTPTDSSFVVITGFQQDTIMGDYELQYITLDSLFTAGSDCDWEFSDFGIYTGAVGTSCNNLNVGVGDIAFEKDKIHVLFDVPDTVSGAPTGIYTLVNVNDHDPSNAYGHQIAVLSDSTDRRRYGVYTTVEGGSPAIGGYFKANANYPNSDGEQSVGVQGIAYGAKEVNIGLYGLAQRPVCTPMPTNIGVYGEAEASSCSNVTDYAGYFVGSSVDTQSPISISDSQLKEDVVELNDALEIIQQLNPMEYSYRTDEYSYMNMEVGTQLGFLAEEVEILLPSAVKDIVFPARYDTSGAQISETHQFKGIQYQELIPLLTSGIKEQQAIIENLEGRLSEIEAMLIGGSKQDNPGDSKTMDHSKSERYELYQNRPNPFNEITEIVWRMAQDAQARMVIHDVQGNLIAILYEGSSSKGLHSLEWNAIGMNTGTYYYSLEVDGEMQIKRAVKLR